MKQLFTNMIDKIEWIAFDVWILNAYICYKNEYENIFYGYRSLKDLYLNKINQSLLQNVQHLYHH